MPNAAGALPIPPVAEQDRRAIELARVWAVKGAQHVSLRPDAWPDPGAWGILFVDLAKHVADALREESGRDPADTLRRIKAGFDAEWSHPTDRPKGGFIG